MFSKIFFFVLFVSLPLYQAQDIVGTTCDKVIFKDLCKTTLASSSAKDEHDVAEAALKALAAVATDAQKQVDANTDPSIKNLVATCSDIYKTAISHLADASTALAARKYNDAVILTSAAMRNQRSCEDGFRKAAQTSPFTEINTKFSELGSATLTITGIASTQAAN